MQLINRWVGLVGMGLMLTTSAGCGLAVIPGLVGVGAGGYLWGKEAARDTPKVTVDAGVPPGQREPLPPK